MAGSTDRAESAHDNPTLQSPNLRIAVSAALKHYGLSPTRFGRNAVNDPVFVSALRNGREVRPATADRVRAYIASLGGC